MECLQRRAEGALEGAGLRGTPEAEEVALTSGQLTLAHVPSPLGTLLLVTDGGAGQLRALDFEDHTPRLRRLLQRQVRGDVTELPSRPAPASIEGSLRAYFAGELDALVTVVLAAFGTPFQKRVWRELRAIPSGSTTTYGDVARAIGQPTASRAVGLANGSNPVALVIPCHRVIGASGSLTGYGGGLDRKRWLLAHEERWRPRGATR